MKRHTNRNLPRPSQAARWLSRLTLVIALMFIWGPAQAGLIRDTEIESELGQMIDPLLVAAGYTPGSVGIRVVLDDSFNAYVMDSHHIYVHSGLILKSKSANELLGVMAHEIAHIKAGHVTRMSEDIQTAGTATALAALAAIAVAASGGGEAAAGVLIGGNDRARRNLLGAVRQNESVADEIGLKLLDKTKISAVGLRDLMQRMARQRALPENRQSEYYTTHPGAAQRLLTYQDHVTHSEYSAYEMPPVVTQIFNRVKTKLYAWTERPQRVLTTQPPDSTPLMQTYAKAIASYRRGQLDDALAFIDNATITRPNDPYFWEFRGDILFSMAAPLASAESYAQALTLRPDSPQILVNQGRALIATADKAQLPAAIDALRKARSLDPQWAFTHRQLGIAYGKNGQLDAADMSLAEEAILRGDNSRAVQLAKRVLNREGTTAELTSRANDIVFTFGTTE